ncbi:unnamed protein product, partial [Heterosigma akashiwo]
HGAGEVRVAVPGRGRGAPPEERELHVQPDGAVVRGGAPAADHGHAAAEQPARALGAAQLPAAGRVQLQRAVRRVVQPGRGRRGGQAHHDPAAAQDPAP